MSTRAVPLTVPETGAERRQRRRLLPHRHNPQQAMAAFNRVRCECCGVARGAHNDDNRCTEALWSDELEQGRTLCSRCRPPDCLAISRPRGRRIAQTLEAKIQLRSSCLAWSSSLPSASRPQGEERSASSSSTHTQGATAPVVPVAHKTSQLRIRRTRVPGSKEIQLGVLAGAGSAEAFLIK